MPHEDAVRTLIEEEDPALRIDAHLLLGRRALDHENAESARHHFRAAVDLDPTDERPRAALLEVEGARTRPSSKPPRATFWRWIFRSRSAEA